MGFLGGGWLVDVLFIFHYFPKTNLPSEPLRKGFFFKLNCSHLRHFVGAGWYKAGEKANWKRGNRLMLNAGIIYHMKIIINGVDINFGKCHDKSSTKIELNSKLNFSFSFFSSVVNLCMFMKYLFFQFFFLFPSSFFISFQYLVFWLKMENMSPSSKYDVCEYECGCVWNI